MAVPTSLIFIARIMKKLNVLFDVSAYGSKKSNLIREGFWLIVTTKEWT